MSFVPPLLSSVFLVLLLQTAAAEPYAAVGVCAKCHPGIDRAYRQTGMARSLVKPAPANTIEDYRNKNEFLHSPSETHYSMIVRGGAYYQRRWQTGFDGQDTNVEEMKIDKIIGSGNHARSYLHRTAAGGYIELPLGWYAEKGGFWDMSPGFDTPRLQTRRLVSYQCVFCHDAYPTIPAAHDTPASEPVFSAELPEGIDCQRCHGPGAEHVSLASSASPKVDDVRASIVNPARLSPEKRMGVCMQCHLEPMSGTVYSRIRRFDRGPFSFSAGEPLSNFLLVFDDKPGTGYDDKFEIVNSSAYRLRKSACFLKSKGALTCTTCHDPHGERVVDYSNACKQCHAVTIEAAVAAGRHPAATECVSCHMQKRRTDDVVHAVMTDHWIQKRFSATDPLAELPDRQNAMAERRANAVPYYPSPLPDADQGSLYLAVAQGIPDNLAHELAKVKPREPEFYKTLGDDWQKSGEPKQAAVAYRQALQMNPQFLPALLSLATVLSFSRDLVEAESISNRALEVEPGSAASWFQSGALEFELEKTGLAIEKIKKAAAIDPDLPGVQLALAEIWWKDGQAESAENALRAALRTDPSNATAYDLMGRILATQGRAAESTFDFEKAGRLRPSHATRR